MRQQADAAASKSPRLSPPNPAPPATATRTTESRPGRPASTPRHGIVPARSNNRHPQVIQPRSARAARYPRVLGQQRLDTAPQLIGDHPRTRTTRHTCSTPRHRREVTRIPPKPPLCVSNPKPANAPGTGSAASWTCSGCAPRTSGVRVASRPAVPCGRATSVSATRTLVSLTVPFNEESVPPLSTEHRGRTAVRQRDMRTERKLPPLRRWWSAGPYPLRATPCSTATATHRDPSAGPGNCEV